MQLRVEFQCEGQDLPPPTFLDDERDPSEAPPQRSRTLASKQTRGRGLPSKKTLPSISEVGESRHTSKPSREWGHCDKDQQKRHHYQRSPESTRWAHSKKNCSIEIEPFAKWIHIVSLNLSLKIPQFVLYSGQSRPLEHICYYKSTIRLVTHDDAILCKAFPSTLFDKALTWFTLLKLETIDSWLALEKFFLDKFSTVGMISKTRGDLASIKQREDKSLLSYLEPFKKTYVNLRESVKTL